MPKTILALVLLAGVTGCKSSGPPGKPDASSSAPDGSASSPDFAGADFAGADLATVDLASVDYAGGPTGIAGGCGMLLADTPTIFCDTFDAPAGTTNRSGDLNGNVWGVSRATGDINIGQGEYNRWNATQLDKCDGTTPTVVAPHDIIICNGQVREATNDNNSLEFEAGTVTSLAMYPKQPFDFANRTGTVSFDVSNDTAGSHAAWPEFWLSDLPVPDPFNHFDSWASLPQNSLGIRFHANADPASGGSCPNGDNLDKYRWTVGAAVVSRNYAFEDTEGPYGTLTGVKVTQTDCVIGSTGPGNMNHIELRISQQQVDVYATDAGVVPTKDTLKHIAVITGVNLQFSKGLIWIEDAHYNADKGDASRPTQRQHTFSWDNVAFDGPFTARDFSYDAPDNDAAGANGSINLAKHSDINASTSWSVPGLPANPNPAAVRVLFNFSTAGFDNPTSFNIGVNGHAHSLAWPYPDTVPKSWRTLAYTVPVTDLVTGTNVVTLGGDAQLLFGNVNIVLGDVPGGVPVLPGASTTYP